MMKYMVSILVAAVLAGAILAGCGGKKAPVTETRFLMNTYCTITVPGTERGAVEGIRKAFERIAEIDAKFNAANAASPLYAFNNAGRPLRDPEALAVLETALEISGESGGAFDPSVYPLTKLWGFFGGKPALPARREIAAVLDKVGYGKIVVNDGEARPGRAGVSIDLGGIIPGYAADEAMKVLKSRGIRSALIDAGGELYALGTNEGKKWRIGVKDPRGEGIIGVIEAQDEAVSTSGDYENYFEAGGRRYHHILDPSTGYPAGGLVSVTIIAPLAARADGWSTAFFVMGADRGFAALSRKPGFEALAVTPDGKIVLSPGMRSRFTPSK